MKSIKGKAAAAAFGLALCAGVSATAAHAGPSSDYGIVFNGPATLTLSDSTGASMPFSASATGYGISTTGTTSAPQSGSFDGVTYGSVFRFDVSTVNGIPSNPFGFPGNGFPGLPGSGGGTTTYTPPVYNQASLTLNYSSVVGTPILTLVSTTSGGFGPSPVGAAGVFGQNFTLTPSGAPGSVTLNLGSNYASNLQSNVSTGGSVFSLFGGGAFLQVVATATSGGGSGVPGPIAGAGLPVLAAAGLAWLRRRRRAIAA